jgi:hypothetical protein
MSLSITGCFYGKRPFLNARVCLTRRDDIVQFVELVRYLGRNEHMTYFDRSAETRLERAANPNAIARKDGFTVNLGITRPDGMGVTAGELGGSGYQIALGFSDGSNRTEARQFAIAVIREIRKRWPVQVIPGSLGVQPSNDCRWNYGDSALHCRLARCEVMGESDG